MLRLANRAILTVALLLTGCASSGLKPGDITSRYDPATRKVPAATQVRQAGTYELVSVTTGQVIKQADMPVGAFYGFRMDDQIATGFYQQSGAGGGLQDTVIRIDDAGDRQYAWRVVQVQPR